MNSKKDDPTRRSPAKYRLTRPDQLTMTPKVEFSKYSLNVLYVVDFILRNVKSCKNDINTNLKSIFSTFVFFISVFVNIVNSNCMVLTWTSLHHHKRINFPADKK